MFSICSFFVLLTIIPLFLTLNRGIWRDYDHQFPYQVFLFTFPLYDGQTPPKDIPDNLCHGALVNGHTIVTSLSCYSPDKHEQTIIKGDRVFVGQLGSDKGAFRILGSWRGEVIRARRSKKYPGTGYFNQSGLVILNITDKFLDETNFVKYVLPPVSEVELYSEKLYVTSLGESIEDTTGDKQLDINIKYLITYRVPKEVCLNYLEEHGVYSKIEKEIKSFLQRETYMCFENEWVENSTHYQPNICILDIGAPLVSPSNVTGKYHLHGISLAPLCKCGHCRLFIAEKIFGELNFTEDGEVWHHSKYEFIGDGTEIEQKEKPKAMFSTTSLLCIILIGCCIVCCIFVVDIVIFRGKRVKKVEFAFSKGGSSTTNSWEMNGEFSASSSGSDLSESSDFSDVFQTEEEEESTDI